MPSLSARTDNELFRKFGIERNIRPGGRLEMWARCLIRLLRELRAEATWIAGIPWRKRFRAWRRGFRSIYAEAYGLDGTNDSLYVADFPYAYHSYRMNGAWNPIIGNKLVVSEVLAAHRIPHPRVVGILAKGRLMNHEAGTSDSGMDALERWTENSRAAVFRPHWSGGGQGVFFVRRSGTEWTVNGHPAGRADVKALLDALDRYVVTEFVEQAEYARHIFPLTTNTIRVLTIIDDDGAFVASVAHRFGTSRSLPIDNFRQGRGLCAAVDVETGTLGAALSLTPRFERVWHTSHPETGNPIEGVTIPGLARSLEGSLAAARCFPEAACVGWDVAITTDGFSILEANAPPGIVVSQIHLPLLACPRAARFFARHGCATPSRF